MSKEDELAAALKAKNSELALTIIPLIENVTFYVDCEIDDRVINCAFLACEQGDEKVLQALIKACERPDDNQTRIKKSELLTIQDKYRQNLGHYAQKNHHMNIANLLLSLVPANFTRGDKIGGQVGNMTPLHYAALNNDLAFLEAYCLFCLNNPSFSSNVDVRNKEGNTPLHLAAVNGHAEAIRILLKLNANPQAYNNAAITPIGSAPEKAKEAFGPTTPLSLLEKCVIYAATTNNNLTLPPVVEKQAESILMAYELSLYAKEHAKDPQWQKYGRQVLLSSIESKPKTP